jgi:hypothetical protein
MITVLISGVLVETDIIEHGMKVYEIGKPTATHSIFTVTM